MNLEESLDCTEGSLVADNPENKSCIKVYTVDRG